MVQPTGPTGEVRPKKKMVTRMKASAPSRFDANRSKRELATQAARALRTNSEVMKQQTTTTTTTAKQQSPERQHRDNCVIGLMARAQQTQQRRTCDDDSFTYRDNTTAREDDSLSSGEYSSESSAYGSGTDLGDSFSLSMPSTSGSQSFEKDEEPGQGQEEAEVVQEDCAEIMGQEEVGVVQEDCPGIINQSKSDADPMDELSRGMPSIVWEEQDDDGSAAGGSHSSAETPSVNSMDKCARVPISEGEETGNESGNEEITSVCSPRKNGPDPLSMSKMKKEWGLEKAGTQAIPYQKLRDDERPLLAVTSTGSNSHDDDIEEFHESNEYDEEDRREQYEALSRQCDPLTLEETTCLQVAFPRGAETETAQEQKEAEVKPEQTAAPQPNTHLAVDSMVPFDEVGMNASDDSQTMWQPPMFPDSGLPIEAIKPSPTTRSSFTYYEAEEQEEEEHMLLEPEETSFSFDEAENEDEQAPKKYDLKSPPKLMFCPSPLRKTPPVSPLQRTKNFNSAPTAAASPAPLLLTREPRSVSPRRNASISISPRKKATTKSTTQAYFEELTNVEPEQSSTNMFETTEAMVKPVISPIRKSRRSKSKKYAAVGVELPYRQPPTTTLQNVTPNRLQKLTTPNTPQSPAIPAALSSKALAEKDTDQTRPPIVRVDKDEAESAPGPNSPRHDDQDMMTKGSFSDDEMHLKGNSYPQYIADKMKTPPEQLKGLITVAMTEGPSARRMNACGAFKQLAGVNKRNALSLAWTEGVLVAHSTVLVDPIASDQEMNRTLLSLLSMANIPLNRRIILMSPWMLAGLTKCIEDENPEIFVKAARCVELLAKDKRNRPLMPRNTALMRVLCARLDQYIDLDKTKHQTVETLTELGLNDASKSFDKEQAQAIESVALSAMNTILYLSTGVQISVSLFSSHPQKYCQLPFLL
jgi:hypothetical protein